MVDWRILFISFGVAVALFECGKHHAADNADECRRSYGQHMQEQHDPYKDDQ